jgi:hypothetical protein
VLQYDRLTPLALYLCDGVASHQPNRQWWLSPETLDVETVKRGSVADYGAVTGEPARRSK